MPACSPRRPRSRSGRSDARSRSSAARLVTGAARRRVTHGRDADGEFFQAAPPDQQIDALRDDERILLEYLHPDHPSLTTKLSGVHPRAFVEMPGAPPRDLVMTADTLWIDTDRALCTMTWRGQVAVEGPDQPGRVLVAVEERDRKSVV